MMLPKRSDALHLAWMYRILKAIADNAYLTAQLRFKGGTCAAMRGLIDRFSVDLDFDLLEVRKKKKISSEFETIFRELGLEIKDKSANVPQYFLRYPQTEENPRTTIKIDVNFPPAKSNGYEAVLFSQIDRIIHCYTVPTMFAHKLIALIARWERSSSIAARDLFDIHTFFIKGYDCNEEVIQEIRGKTLQDFKKELVNFIEKHLSQKLIDQDLNALLPPKDFQRIREILKQETLIFLSN